MPAIRFDWKIVPSIVLTVAQIIALLIVIGAWKGRKDVEATQSAATIQRLENSLSQSISTQALVSDRMTKVETKVDLIMPKLDRIEARVMGERPAPFYGMR